MRSVQSVFVNISAACVLTVSSSGALYAGQPKDPCTLLTVAQVSAELKAPVGAGMSTTADHTGCAWHTSSGASQMVTLQVLDASKVFTSGTTHLLGVSTSSVRGLGDEAAYATMGNMTRLSVKKGAVGFVIRIYGEPNEDRQMAIEKALAAKVLAKL